MRMIQTSYSLLASVTVFALISGTAYAQQGSEALPWPKTFVGQPDFDYLRQDIINEYQKKKGIEAGRYIATLEDLMKQREINPFVPKPVTTDIGRSKYSKEVFEQRFGLKEEPRDFRDVYPDIEVGTGMELTLNDGTVAKAELISDTEVKLLEDQRVIKIKVDTEGKVIEERSFEKTIAETFDNLFLSGGDLKGAKKANTSNENDEEASTEEDALSEYRISVDLLKNIDDIPENDRDGLKNFASFIQNVITQATRRHTADIDTNFRKYINSIVLQSIVSSPFKYAIIDGKRYQVGGRIPLSIKVQEIDTTQVNKIIDAYMPKKESLEEETYKSYLALKEEAIKQYKERLETEGKEQSSNTQVIHAIVKDIQPRRVIVDILGEEYLLDIKFTL